MATGSQNAMAHTKSRDGGYNALRCWNMDIHRRTATLHTVPKRRRATPRENHN